jgi:hypothetical protein
MPTAASITKGHHYYVYIQLHQTHAACKMMQCNKGFDACRGGCAHASAVPCCPLCCGPACCPLLCRCDLLCPRCAPAVPLLCTMCPAVPCCAPLSPAVVDVPAVPSCRGGCACCACRGGEDVADASDVAGRGVPLCCALLCLAVMCPSAYMKPPVHRAGKTGSNAYVPGARKRSRFTPRFTPGALHHPAPSPPLRGR